MKELHYTFSVEHAEKYGLNEAIMLHNFIYWLNINRANNHNYIDGRHWTYNSAKAFQNLFPFWTQKQIQYLLSKMVDYGILLQGCFNKDKRDRTSWYTLSDEFFSDCILQNREMDTTKSGNDILQNREMIYITDKKQQIKNTNENNINTASGFSQSDFLENFIKERLSKMSESEKAGYYAFTVTQLESLAEKLGRPLTQMECQEKCKMVLDNMYLEDENPVVKDSLITQNPTAKESLTVQKQKKEEEVEAIPNCIDISKWEEWKNYKKEKKQKLTKSTAGKQLQNLQKWHLEGQDPNEIIDNSISNGWAGLFPLKQQKPTFNNQYAKPKLSTTSQVAEMFRTQAQYIENNKQTNDDEDEHPF
jgi:hypothetical protein